MSLLDFVAGKKITTERVADLEKGQKGWIPHSAILKGPHSAAQNGPASYYLDGEQRVSRSFGSDNRVRVKQTGRGIKIDITDSHDYLSSRLNDVSRSASPVPVTAVVSRVTCG